MEELLRALGRKRPRRVGLTVPPFLLPALEQLKDQCQDADMYLSGRQRIGNDGVILSAMTWLLAQKESDQFDIVKKGYGELKSKIVPPTPAPAGAATTS